MTPYERVFNRIKGQSVDRIPNFCIIMTFAAKYCGVTYKEFVTNYKVFVDCVLRCCEDFEIDLLCAISDPMREAHGFGARIVISDDDVPHPESTLLTDLNQISKLKIIKPEDDERMLDRINAISLFKKKSNGHYPIAGWVEGPIAEACDLRNINNFLIDLYDDEEAVKELLEICTLQAIEFAKSQIREGAHIIGVGDAAASLISPLMYNKFALPYEKKIIDEIHKMGALVKLHICGNINSILDSVVLTGADMIDCDWMVDFEHAASVFKDKSIAVGNFDPVSVLLQGDVNTVRNQVELCAKVAYDNVIIAAGCEVPKFTPIQNLKEVSKTLWLISGKSEYIVSLTR
jgi:MtaA/CmuA family methyltransferase